MPECTNGSEPADGAPTYFTIPQAVINARFGLVAGWLTNWAMGLSDGPYETASFCATEPTGDLPTPADYPLLGLPPVALLAGTYKRFGNQLKRDMFNEYCACSAVEVTNPACGYTVGPINTSPGAGVALDVAAIPAGSNVGDVAHVTMNQINFHSGTQATVRAWSYPSGTQIFNEVRTLGGGSWSFGLTVLTGDDNIGLRIFPNNGSTSLQINNLQISTTASGCTPEPTEYPSPPALEPPAGFVGPPSFECEDIEDVCEALTELKGDLRIINGMVTLIQRQAVPFAAVPGQTYGPLTGAGILDVQGILGLSVNITTYPSNYGAVLTAPPFLFDLGWITLGTDDGWQPAQRVQHDPMLLLPQLASIITKAAYNFPAGVVASISTIEREP